MNANRKALLDALVLTAVLAMLFLSWPALDLWFSGLFHSDWDGFWMGKPLLVQVVRELIWKLILAVFFFAMIALAFSKIFRSTTPRLDKVWEVIVMTYLLGPGLLTNAILKEYWGRARPAHVSEFGGIRDFSPPIVISDQCATNCSFVSGEGSGATAMLIAILLILRNQAPGRYTRMLTWATFLVAGLGLSLRVLMGRHFLSDTLFAVLFVSIIALGLLQLKRYRTLRLF